MGVSIINYFPFIGKMNNEEAYNIYTRNWLHLLIGFVIIMSLFIVGKLASAFRTTSCLLIQLIELY